MDLKGRWLHIVVQKYVLYKGFCWIKVGIKCKYVCGYVQPLSIFFSFLAVVGID